MSGGALEAELQRVTAELAEARTQHAVLGARVSGLEAHHAALTTAIGAARNPSPAAGGAYRTDAIVAVLEASSAPMSISEVVAALGKAGRPGETSENIGVDLAYLVERGRAVRVRRGVYGAVREIGTDRIVLTLAQDHIDHGHLPLADHLAFFPAEAVGQPNARQGAGRMLRLGFDGLPFEPVETDIVSDPVTFRSRGAVRGFLLQHGLGAGDRIAIDRVAEYEYTVRLVR